MHGVRGIPLQMKITNAGESSYPDSWIDWMPYQACMSYDQKKWTRCVELHLGMSTRDEKTQETFHPAALS